MPIIKKEEIKVAGNIVLEKQAWPAGRAQPAAASSALGRIPATASEITDSAPAPAADALDRQEAREYISSLKARAQQEVEKILAAAQTQAKQEMDESRKKGYAAGQQQARSETGQKTAQALATLNEALALKKKIIKSSEPDILKLALKIAEQIIRSEVSLNKDVVMNIVAEAVAKITDREQVVIRVNPANLEQIKVQRSRLLSLIDGVKNLTIQEDSQVDPGGCIIETSLGFVDARLATKLAAVEEALQKVGEDEKSGGD